MSNSKDLSHGKHKEGRDVSPAFTFANAVRERKNNSNAAVSNNANSSDPKEGKEIHGENRRNWGKLVLETSGCILKTETTDQTLGLETEEVFCGREIYVLT